MKLLKVSINLLLGLLALTLGPQLTLAFTDVSIAHPMHTSINYLAERGYVSGYEDGSFKPDRIVTRAEILKFALKAAEIEPQVNGEVPFSDVATDVWYYPYVATASEKNIVSGYDDGTFQPDRRVTRAEGIKIILNALDVDLPENYQLNLKDVSSEDWYAPYVAYVQDFNILTIDGNTFNPDQGLRRQDIAEIVYNFVVAREIYRTEAWQLVPWLVFGALYLLLAGYIFLVTRQKKFWYLYVLIGPLSIYYLIYKQIKWSPPAKAKANNDNIVSHRRQFAYFRRSRRIEREVLAWLDQNAKPLLVLWSSFLILLVMTFVVISQINTIDYQRSYINLAQTYVDTDQ